MPTNVNLKLATLALCAILLLDGCTGNRSSSDTSNPQSTSEVQITADEKSPEKPLFKERKKTLKVYEQELREKYLCKPNAIFLQAFVSVHDICSRKTGASANAGWQNGQWVITIDGKTAGTLAEFPSFGEFYKLLIQYAREEIRRSNLALSGSHSPRKIDNLKPNALLQLLAQSGMEFNAHPQWNTLWTAAQAASWLTIEQLDLLEVCDQMPAKALALQAIAAASENDSKQSPVDTLYLLADALGYSSFAVSKLNEINDVDIKSYLNRSAEHLKSVATRTDSSFESQFLYASLLAKLQHQTEWRKFATEKLAKDKSGSLASLKTFYPLAGDDSLLPLGASLMSAVNTQMRYGEARHEINIKRLTWSFETLSNSADYLLGDLLSEFEENTKFLARNEQNPFLSNELLVQYYRGYFYSAVKLVADAYLALPSARPICERLADNLRVKKLLQSQELEEWLRLRIKEGESGGRNLASSLAKLKKLGAPALIDLSFKFAHSPTSVATYASDAQTCQMLLSRCDSRVSHLDFLARLSAGRLRDARLARNYNIAHWNETLDSERNNFGLLKFTYSKSKTWSILASTTSRPASVFEQITMIKELATSSLDEKSQIVAYASVAKRNPHSWLAVSTLANALIARNEAPKAVQTVHEWLAANPRTTTQELVEARSMSALALYKLSRFDQAEKELGGKTTDFFSWIKMKALLSLSRNQSKEALSYAQGALDRYPSNLDALSLYLFICWKTGLYDMAAKLLTAHANQLSATDFDTAIGDAFANAFDKHDNTQAMKAVEALASYHLNTAGILGRLSAAAFRHGNVALAFDLLHDTAADYNQQPVRYLNGYFYLRKMRGRKAALEWLDKQIPPEGRNELAAPAFLLGLNELLFSFIPDKPRGAHAEQVWLLRAAAACHSHAVTDSQLSQLKAHARDQPEPYGVVSRYLLGLSAEEALTEKDMTDLELCRAAFFLSWKRARHTDKLVDALAGFTASAQTMQSEAPEFSWSLNWLANILSENESLLSVSPKNTVLMTIRDWSLPRNTSLPESALNSAYDIHYEIR